MGVRRSLDAPTNKPAIEQHRPWAHKMQADAIDLYMRTQMVMAQGNASPGDGHEVKMAIPAPTAERPKVGSHNKTGLVSAC